MKGEISSWKELTEELSEMARAFRCSVDDSKK